MKATVELDEEELKEFLAYREEKRIKHEAYEKALRDLHELAGVIWDAVDAEERRIAYPDKLLLAVKLADKYRCM